MSRKLLALLALTGLAACASAPATKVPEPAAAARVTYFLPKKDFIVTVTVDGQGKSSITFATSTAYPDLSTPYILHHTHNAPVRNALDIQVSASGLLSELTLARASDRNADDLKPRAALAPANAEIRAAGPTCERAGIYKAVLPAQDTRDSVPAVICNYHIVITRYLAARRSDGMPIAGSSERESHTGVFYRREEPYLITAMPRGHSARDKSTLIQDIRYSPSHSATHFLPIAREAFATRDARFTLEDGVLQQHQPLNDRARLGFAVMPAAPNTAASHP